MEGLYYTPRTYFDPFCTEYSDYPIKKKLLDIGYATWRGHDIMEDIRYILDNYSYVSEDNIRYAIHQLLAELNHQSAVNYNEERKNDTLEADVRMLIKDLMKVYRLPTEEPAKAYLAEDPKRIYFRELSSMNGWVEALRENRQPYQMYSYGHWIMFPGDGEIIRDFNLNNCSHHRGYISYVYPEPWYGSPTTAKIIILGNDAHYEDYISRTQNLLLSQLPAIAESVQVTIDRCLELKKGKFFDEDYIGFKKDGLKVHEIYNSPTYHYWLKKIREFADYMYIPYSKIYDSIAVINANPYPARNVGPLEPGLLPSHYFLRQMVRYIVNHNKDVVFIIPAAHLQPVWDDILDDVYDTIISQNQTIVTSRNNRISLLDKLNTDYIKKILDVLYE